MRPVDGKAWRKTGRLGREGDQVVTPRLARAIRSARELHTLETALADPGSNVVRLVWDRSELVTAGGVS
jgi:hypothetical protein